MGVGERQACVWSFDPPFVFRRCAAGHGVGRPPVGRSPLKVRLPDGQSLQVAEGATTADVLTYTELPATIIASIHGRAVTMRWGDSFTTFLGLNDGLVTAVLGDSNGFLDIPRGALFQGSQPLEVSLLRLFWPGAQPQGAAPPSDTEWDFVFAGISLLPAGVNQSGSAG